LDRIVGALHTERSQLERIHGRRVPLLVKIAPDMDQEQLTSLAVALRALGVEGVIATNTSTDLSGLGTDWPDSRRGGLSGAPLHASSLRVIRQLRSELGPDFPIIGVGGIVSADHALATLNAGANLIQIYSGFAYRGYRLVEEILDALRP
jgi:dihydroorotate dehydrogenase